LGGLGEIPVQVGGRQGNQRETLSGQH
jgi:hypothetical protein